MAEEVDGDADEQDELELETAEMRAGGRKPRSGSCPELGRDHVRSAAHAGVTSAAVRVVLTLPSRT
jgi:hypothetical protein